MKSRVVEDWQLDMGHLKPAMAKIYADIDGPTVAIRSVQAVLSGWYEPVEILPLLKISTLTGMKDFIKSKHLQFQDAVEDWDGPGAA